MVAANHFGLRVFRTVGSREDVLPFPFLVGVWRFAFKGIWEIYRAAAFGQVFFVKGFGVLQLSFYRIEDAAGEGGDPVAAAFAITYHNLAVGKVHVFYTKPKTFHKTESAAVHDLYCELIYSSHAVNNAADFFLRQDGGDIFCTLRAESGNYVFVQGDVQDVTVKEENGADCLVLCGSGYFSVRDDMNNELVDLFGSHFCRVAFVMVDDIFPDPLNVGFTGARGVLFGLDGVTVLVQ